jgi:alkanesulfonate monooxygenase SsuD/methylene tetrahydromethanopterin reductase-like flavin-dependent oxidoreductase (luciferase family)
MHMQYAIEVVPFGEFSDPCLFVRLASAAEEAGWDGIFVWDHLAYAFGWSGMDPWVALSAAASHTRRIRLGVDVAPLPRYRPHVLAQTVTTLDHLSQGRVTLGFGLGGSTEEFSIFGEDSDTSRRAAMLDEGLQVLDYLLRGQKVDYRGQYYAVNGATLNPTPVQEPRPPVWIGGDKPPALRRAAHWDGWVYPANDMDGKMVLSPDWLAEKLSLIKAERGSLEGFDCALSGCSQPGENDLPFSYARAGATWWLETLFGSRGSADEMLQRVKAGPPK